MKKTLLMAGALLALTAGIASAAGGINLGWGDCGGGPSTASKTFACTSNTLAGAIMVASAVAPVPMDQLNGEESEFILQTNAAALSNWWALQAGGCRGTTAAAVNFDFTGGPFTCLDPWSGQAAGGMSYDFAFGAPNRARIRTIGAIPGSTSIDDSSEYYFFKVTLLGAKSTGNGSCAGCTDGMCIVFTQLKLTQPLGVGDYTMTNPIVSQYATWQAGGNSVQGGCPGATPTQSRTWGSVKSLYR
jgi:hypothetical protein